MGHVKPVQISQTESFNMQDKLIEAKNVSLKINDRNILEHVNFSIAKGEIAIFIGPNGGGKSSLVKTLLGLYKPSSGEVITKDGLKVGYVPQKFKISPFLPLNVRRLLNMPKKHNDDALLAVLKKTRAEHLIDKQVVYLSGGEMQRILIARAMLNNPDLLVLDEPLQGVDQRGEVELNQLISDFSCEYNCAVIMVSHDLHLVMKSASQVYCINGHICCQGKAESIKNEAEFKEIFGHHADQFAYYTHHHDDHCEHHDHQ